MVLTDKEMALLHAFYEWLHAEAVLEDEMSTEEVLEAFAQYVSESDAEPVETGY